MSDASLGSLLAKIGLDTSELKKGVSESHGLMSSMQGAAKGVALGVAGIATAAVAFGAQSAHTFANVGGEVLKLQRYTGGTAESMSALRFAAQESGVNVDDLGKSMGLLSRKIEAGKDGLDKYGVATKDAHGKVRPLNDILLDTATVFEKMPNGVEKNALAMQLFGKAGMGMVPFLNRGKDGLSALEKEADKFGLTLSQKNLDAVKKNTMAHREFHAAMQGLQVQIGQYVLPIMTEFTSRLVSVLVPAIGLMRSVMGPLVEGIKFFWSLLLGPNNATRNITTVTESMGGMMGTVSRIVVAVREFFHMLITGFSYDEGTPVEKFARMLRETFLPIIREIIDWIGDHLKPILIGLGITVAVLLAPFASAAAALIFLYVRFKIVREGVAALVTGVKVAAAAIGSWIRDSRRTWQQWGDGIRDILQRVVAVFREVFIIIGIVVYAAIQVLSGLWDRFGSHLLDHMKTAFNALVMVFKGVFEILRGVFVLFADLFTGKWGKLWGDVKAIFKGVWDLIVGLLRWELNLISTAIGLAMAVISQAWHYIWFGIKAVFGAVWAGISTLLRFELNTIRAFLLTELHIVEAVWRAVWTAIRDVAGAVWGAIRAVIDAGVGFVRGIIEAGVHAFEAVWHAVWGGIRDVTVWTWDLLKGWVSAGVGFVKDVIINEVHGFEAIWHAVWGGIRDVTVWTWELLKGWVNAGVGFVRDVIVNTVNTVRDVWSGVWGGIRDVFSGIWEGIKDVARGGINFIIDVLNHFIRLWNGIHISIPKVHVPGTSIDIGGGEIGLPNIPEIPRFHSGVTRIQGPANQEILAILRGGERVVSNPSEPINGNGGRPTGEVHQHVHYDIHSEINALGSPQEIGAAAAAELDWLLAQRS